MFRRKRLPWNLYEEDRRSFAVGQQRRALDETKQEVAAVYCSLLGDIVQRIGEDLHEGLCQHLSATAIAAGLLEQKLGKKSLPDMTAAHQIVNLINQATSRAPHLASSLYPVALETAGLAAAREQLALNVSEWCDVDCQFCENGKPSIRDAAVVRHLYRIGRHDRDLLLREGSAWLKQRRAHEARRCDR
jgi:signal transduction histidine kinase